MDQQVEQILQKIHFIERDIELHKNILMSTPEQKKDEMERVVAQIVQMKERVDELKRSIAEIDPETHAQIVKLEEGTKKFQQLAAEKKFQQVFTLDQIGECRIDLIDGTQIECLVKALDERGGWVGLTHDGEVVEYPVEEIMEL